MRLTRRKQPPIRTLISECAVVRGEIHFCDGLRVDGEVHGDVVADAASPSLLVISENARVSGKIKASHVIVWGFVRGEIVSDELLEIQPKAQIDGSVRYELLEMHPGAVVSGELKPLKSHEKRKLTLAASNDA